VEYIEGGWPGSNKKDAEFFSVCKAEIMTNKTQTKLTAFGATRRKGTTCDEVGAHSSIVEASFHALVDGLEFGIVNCSE
ncbi:hypothetical protein GOP47_0025796, partial [Adiantum capillus-veneris]